MIAKYLSTCKPPALSIDMIDNYLFLFYSMEIIVFICYYVTSYINRLNACRMTINIKRTVIPMVMACVSLILYIACGDGSPLLRHKKKYYFVVSPSTPENLHVVKSYFHEFNSQFSSEVLHLTRRGGLPSDQISSITFTPNMSKKEGKDKDKLGWAHWESCTRFTNLQDWLKGPHKILTKIHTMHIEFDGTQLKAWHNSQQDQDLLKAKSLFYHELGHGFHMKHEPENSSVMYATINSSPKNFRDFYLKSERFLNEN